MGPSQEEYKIAKTWKEQWVETAMYSANLFSIPLGHRAVLYFSHSHTGF